MIQLIYLLVIALIIVSLWKVFEKAGQPGWAAIIPFYNLYIMLKIALKPGWWLILFFIPVVNLIVNFILCMAIAEKFGKGVGFAVGLFFLPFIFIPILAFSDAKYSIATV
ncbi:MAG: DUF5684 domain-containing protein [Phycisphaerales bacterium]